ncbi:MAG: glycosyltransferase [Pseudomonadota bacterium]
MRVDVCICTFRRPSVAATLRSIYEQALPQDVEMRVIVVDNDTSPSSRTRVWRAADMAERSVRYIHRAGQNISVARNAALESSRADLIAFLDDDETAPPNWIATLLETRQRTGADVVLGPVVSTYAEAAPGWMQRTSPHATNPVEVEGEIRTGYTCNVLFDRSAAAFGDLRFDPALGRSGGEDTRFFSQAHANGARFAFAPDAPVFEPVPEDRARLSWLARRRFRMGQTHAETLRARAGFSPLREIAVAAAKATYCGASAMLALPSPTRRNIALLRGALHVGVVAALVGARSLTLYGDTERPAP